MPHRLQQTIARACTLQGVGFFTGADVTLSFSPADENYGVRFQRTDCPETPAVPADLTHAVNCHRRTAIETGDVQITMIEHVMAALAGLRIDNCLVQLDAPEPPGFDGSSRAMVDTLLECGIVTQSAVRERIAVTSPVSVNDGADGDRMLRAEPADGDGLQITYELDYGPDSPIPAQSHTVRITPETFIDEIAAARTFVLEAEVAELRGRGYGTRITARDLLVFGPGGVIENEQHWANECARHKLLDCVGDFALLGCDLSGHIHACRSGHALNQALIRAIAKAEDRRIPSDAPSAEAA